MDVKEAKMATRLRTFDGAAPSISESDGAGMLVFLDEPGAAMMTARIGVEIITGRRQSGAHSIDVTRGEAYPAQDGGSVVGGRYLMREAGPGTAIIGALNYTLRRLGSRQQAVVSNLVVAPGRRRQGVATRLLEQMLNDYPKASADTSMTTDGAAFLGYSAATKGSAPARRARP